MSASDAFSEYNAELLQGTYDGADRVVLNAYFPLGQTGGGLRAWVALSARRRLDAG